MRSKKLSTSKDRSKSQPSIEYPIPNTPPSVLNKRDTRTGAGHAQAPRPSNPSGAEVDARDPGSECRTERAHAPADRHRQDTWVAKVGSWLPDETLFSLCSRLHSISANGAAATTCLQVFGHARSGIAHDLPSRIDDFVSRTDGALGDSRAIIRQRTLLAFYLPFLEPSAAEHAIAAMRGTTIASLKMALGLPATRLRANHPLKACPSCMSNDRRTFSVAYWHLAHQYPGVWVCPAHGDALLRATVKSTGVGRFQWHLPNEEALEVCVGSQVSRDARLASLLRSLADAAHEVAHRPEGVPFDRAGFTSICIAELQQRGLITPSGRWHPERIGHDLSGFLGQFAAVPELASLALEPSAAVNMLRRLLSAKHAARHPLKYIVVSTWLFGNWLQHLDRHHASPTSMTMLTRPPPRQEGRQAARNRPPAELKARLLDLLTFDHLAPSTAARRLGIDPQTAIVWAAQQGIRTAVRPKKIDNPTRKRLIQGLERGRPKEVLAERSGISVGSVTRILRTEPGLQKKWTGARAREAGDAARRQWLKAMSHASDAGINAVRARASAAYAWLYRNDRAWLDAQKLSIPKLPKGNHAKVDWTSRDLAFASAVQAAAERLQQEQPSRRRHLWQILQLIPDLRPKLPKLDRLPATRSALELLLGAPVPRRPS